MIRCRSCKTENPDLASTCHSCGQAIYPPINEPPTETIQITEFPSTVGDDGNIFGKTVPAAPGLDLEPPTDPLRPNRDSVLARAVPDSDPKPPPGVVTMVERGPAPKTIPAVSKSGTRLGPSAIASPQPESGSKSGVIVTPGAQPRLRVLRGERLDVPPFALLDGKNYIGRFVDKPVDIDLTGQEPTDQVWASRQHAVITVSNGVITIEDLNSLNGTFLNRSRIHPGQGRKLAAGDIIQIGMVQLRIEM